MSLSPVERTNPRDVAKATALAGRFHDVVVGASKVIHGDNLDPGDRSSLLWARDLLNAAGSEDVVLMMPSAQALTGPANAALVLRRAARSDDEGGDPAVVFAELCKAIDAALRGERDKRLLSALDSVRRMFALVSRLALRAEVVAQGEQKPAGSWLPSQTTSPS